MAQFTEATCNYCQIKITERGIKTMASTKLKRSEVDRWTGNAITNVEVPEANKKWIAEYNASLKKKGGSNKPKAPAKKK